MTMGYPWADLILAALASAAVVLTAASFALRKLAAAVKEARAATRELVDAFGDDDNHEAIQRAKRTTQAWDAEQLQQRLDAERDKYSKKEDER